LNREEKLQNETICKDHIGRHRRARGSETADKSESAAVEAGTDSPSMDVDTAGSSKQLGRSRARLANYGKAMGFLKGLVIKRWKEAVQQQKEQRRQAEAATAAAAAAATEAREARERELAALQRALGEANENVDKLRRAAHHWKRQYERVREQ